jgi:hypothetical protein
MANNVNQTPIVASSGFIRSQQFVDIYANNTRIGVSAFDFNMMFGRIIEQAQGVNVIEDLASIRMSPIQFKFFIESASHVFKAWEETFGQIEYPMKLRSKEQLREGMRRLKEELEKTVV